MIKAAKMIGGELKKTKLPRSKPCPNKKKGNKIKKEFVNEFIRKKENFEKLMRKKIKIGMFFFINKLKLVKIVSSIKF